MYTLYYYNIIFIRRLNWCQFAGKNVFSKLVGPHIIYILYSKCIRHRGENGSNFKYDHNGRIHAFILIVVIICRHSPKQTIKKCLQFYIYIQDTLNNNDVIIVYVILYNNNKKLFLEKFKFFHNVWEIWTNITRNVKYFYYTLLSV